MPSQLIAVLRSSMRPSSILRHKRVAAFRSRSRCSASGTVTTAVNVSVGTHDLAARAEAMRGRPFSFG
eukprot:6773315-Prymnesium_polylepis.2